MKQIKIISGKDSQELEKNINEFYAQCNIEGHRILKTDMLSSKGNLVVQIIFNVDEDGNKKR